MLERIAPEPSQKLTTQFYEIAGHVWEDLKLKSRPVSWDASKSYETQDSRTHAYSQVKLTYTNS